MDDTLELIQKSLIKLASIPGARNAFYKRFPKSRAVVSAWKLAKSKPNQEDLALFIKTTSLIIREMEPEFKDIKAKNDAAKSELFNLLSA